MNFDEIAILREKSNLAYLSGNVELSEALEQLADSMDEIDNLKDELESITRKPVDYDEYRQFFSDCFESLASHYPCPSVTNDCDKSVIFDAIRAGENAKN